MKVLGQIRDTGGARLRTPRPVVPPEPLVFKTLAIAIVVVIVALLGFAATRPDTFSVQRMTTIHAPADKVFALINDFHRWGEWSPWEKLDPEMKRSFSGAAAGPGTVYEWTGSAKVGAGRMEILKASPASQIDIKLDFIKPFEGHNITEFTLTPQGEDTQVRWGMHGPAPFVSKLMGVFVSMDSMIGKDFEAGLANMKSAAEK
jgi:carbon monoxide dehydrogenase subunit G